AGGCYVSLGGHATTQGAPATVDAMPGLKTERARGWTDFETCKDVVEREVGGGPYLFGDWFTAADVMIGSMFLWQRMMGNTTGRPRIERYVDRLAARPKAIKLGR